MAIVYDNNAAVVATGSDAASLSGSFTTSGSSSGLLLAACWGDLSADSVTGITYNGVAMAKITSIQAPGDRFVDLFFLANPASGSNTLAASGTHLYNLFAASYAGVSSNTPSSTTNTGSGLSSLATSITVSIPNSWIFLVGKSSVSIPTAGTGTTRRLSTDGGIFDSNGPLSAGSQTLNLNFASSSNYGAIMVAFGPAPAISVTDSITATDTVTLQRVNFISVTDSTAVASTSTTLNLVDTMSVSDFVVIGDAVYLVRTWPTQTKSTTTFTPASESTSNWVNGSLDTSTFTNQSASPLT